LAIVAQNAKDARALLGPHDAIPKNAQGIGKADGDKPMDVPPTGQRGAKFRLGCGQSFDRL
jgi:hypothetical protein